MIYKGFASVYDYLMESTPYDQWYTYLKEHLSSCTGKSILDLACGTGEMTNRLAKDGYKALGVDLSPEMLDIAQQKANSKNLKVHYINQDITELELFHQYDSIISYCDGFNYITDKNALACVFSKVHTYLKDEGLFIFDMSSYYKLSEVLGDHVIAESSEDVSFIWENYFDQENDLLEFDLTIFEKVQEMYKKTEEVHKQRAYHLMEIQSLLETSNFELLSVLDTNTNQCVTDQSERWLFIGRKRNE